MEAQYLNILEKLVSQGEECENRTGINAFKLPPQMIQHHMSDGFPILTTKKIAWKTLKVELEGFIKGVTSKKWFQDRGAKIWDSWCNPQKVPYGNDEETKRKMSAEDDLGPCIYGASWRGFHDPSVWNGQTVDQFKNVVETLKSNPNDRRMLCLAWNPLGLKHTALPACHVLFQISTRANEIDLTWYQRSNDWFLGNPFNIASYGLLLHLFALESGMKPGYLTGFFTDVHLYSGHQEQAKTQLARTPRPLPQIETKNFTSIFDWTADDSELIGYDPHPRIKADVVV
jgi:thymidylate synthase